MYIQDVYKKYLENVWKNKIISEISKILLTVGTLLLGAFPWPKGSLVGIFQKILNYTCKLLCQDLGSHGGVIWGRNSLLGIENSLLVSSRHWKGVRDVSQCRFFVSSGQLPGQCGCCDTISTFWCCLALLSGPFSSVILALLSKKHNLLSAPQAQIHGVSSLWHQWKHSAGLSLWIW